MISEGTNVWVVWIDANGWVAWRLGFVQRAFGVAEGSVIYKLRVNLNGGQDCYAAASRVFLEEREATQAAGVLSDRLDGGLCDHRDRDAVVFHRAD